MIFKKLSVFIFRATAFGNNNSSNKDIKSTKKHEAIPPKNSFTNNLVGSLFLSFLYYRDIWWIKLN